MKKRILSGILSLIMIVTIFPIFSSAEETVSRSISTQGLDMIKQFEGFTSTAIADGAQWSIGYGNACDPWEYPNGITETEADALLQESIVYFETILNKYLDLYGIALEQHEFDALTSITYNLGPAWVNSSYRFWTMLRNGLSNYTDNEIASAIGVWCHVGTAVNTSILQRRIKEIRLFLYGDYAASDSPNFKYLIFDGNGGGIETDIMLYVEGEPYGEFTAAERSGYYFEGWYTSPDGGTRISEQDLATSSHTVYAHWSTTPPAVQQPEEPEETAEPEQTGEYQDVQESDWFYPYVTDLSAAGVVDGYADGTYRPQQDVMAGQALKLLLLAAGYAEQAPVTAHWASGYLFAAMQNGILVGGEITDLDAPISRVLTARIACLALGLEPVSGTSAFSDTDDPYVQALYQAGILEGNVDSSTGERRFYPDSTISRAELAKIVWMLSNQ